MGCLKRYILLQGLFGGCELPNAGTFGLSAPAETSDLGSVTVAVICPRADIREYERVMDW
jgi:hypothetical protein